jgi:hypothetical protein
MNSTPASSSTRRMAKSFAAVSVVGPSATSARLIVFAATSLVYCANYRCSHSVAISSAPWPDDVRLSDIEDQFVCKASGNRGAHVRLDFNWDKTPERATGS